MEIIILDIFSQLHTLNFASLLISATTKHMRPSNHPSFLVVTFIFLRVLIPLPVFIPLSVRILYETNNIKLLSSWLKYNWKIGLGQVSELTVIRVIISKYLLSLLYSSVHSVYFILSQVLHNVDASCSQEHKLARSHTVEIRPVSLTGV